MSASDDAHDRTVTTRRPACLCVSSQIWQNVSVLHMSTCLSRTPPSPLPLPPISPRRTLDPGPASARSVAAGLAQAAWQLGGCEEEGSVNDVNMSRSQRRRVSVVKPIGRGRGRGSIPRLFPVVLQMGKATRDRRCRTCAMHSYPAMFWLTPRGGGCKGPHLQTDEAPYSPLTALPPGRPLFPWRHSMRDTAANHCSWPTTMDEGCGTYYWSTGRDVVGWDVTPQ